MTYVIGTRVRPGNRAAMVQGFTEIARPKMIAAGASRVDGLEWLTGDGAGNWTGVSQWESLHNGFAALEDFYADPEVGVAMEAAAVEPLGRIVGVVEASAGELEGSHMGLTTFSFASPDPARFQSMLDLAVKEAGPLGLKGVQLARMFAAGPGTNSYVAAAVMDNIDAFPQAAATASDVLAEQYAATGATVVDRMIVRVH